MEENEFEILNHLKDSNKTVCDEIAKELDYSMSHSVAHLLAFLSMFSPIGSSLLNDVRKTATKRELKVLREHGMNI